MLHRNNDGPTRQPIELADAGANFAIAVVQLAMAADDNGEYLDELERRAEERWQKIQEECERDPLLRWHVGGNGFGIAALRQRWDDRVYDWCIHNGHI